VRDSVAGKLKAMLASKRPDLVAPAASGPSPGSSTVAKLIHISAKRALRVFLGGNRLTTGE
jgi:hypothetical protein